MSPYTTSELASEAARRPFCARSVPLPCDSSNIRVGPSLGAFGDSPVALRWARRDELVTWARRVGERTVIPGPIDCDNDSDRCVSKLLRTRAVGAVTPSFAASVSDPSGVGTRDRTRPDESGRPSYVTAEGYRRLEEEAHRLWTVDRPRMAKAVEIAAAEGDRSENAEYQYSKRKLAEIDRRLRFLGKRLDVLKVVSEAPPEDGRVYFGTWVRLADRKGVEVVYRIVGPDEFDADRGWISVESP
ncbi:MAG: GreA/GreB family elongation factor, partial [Myxococcales bacterium]|nr:GreA/GreB family elongation factor [Myxococcales bacterium]